jgi:hypothetical protein
VQKEIPPWVVTISAEEAIQNKNLENKGLETRILFFSVEAG